MLKKLKQLETNPFLGKPLGNRLGVDLTGCYKIYLLKKTVRIVYTIRDNICEVRVIAIGKRDKGQVYKQAFENL